ncbi:MAG: TraB/GumN family protein [Pseudomonadota bacterium]
MSNVRNDKRRRGWLIGAALLALTACASTGDDPVATTQTASAATAIQNVDRPAMWRLEDDDSEITLFGTFHVLPPNIEWTSSIYDAAMKSAETTIIETDTQSPEAVAEIQAAVAKFGLNPPGVTLSETLGPDRAQQLSALAEELGVPGSALEPMRPWLALVSLTQVVFQRNGFDPAQGVEASVLAQAAEEGDAVDYLETASFQIEALASLDGDDMFANFDTTIDQFAEFDTMTARLLEAWRTGDVEGIEKDILAPIREASPGAYATLFTNRNVNWTRKIDSLMASDGDYFIAVGAGHLVGPDSVVEMLKKEGYAVTRIQ